QLAWFWGLLCTLKQVQGDAVRSFRTCFGILFHIMHVMLNLFQHLHTLSHRLSQGGHAELVSASPHTPLAGVYPTETLKQVQGDAVGSFRTRFVISFHVMLNSFQHLHRKLDKR